MRTTYFTSISALAFMFLSFTVAANNVDPVSNTTVLLEEEGVTFVVEASLNSAFKSINYSDNSFNLQTEDVIQFVQLINNKGEVEFQMPIGSSSVHLSLENFEAGDYSFNLLLSGSEEFTTTTLSIK